MSHSCTRSGVFVRVKLWVQTDHFRCWKELWKEQKEEDYALNLNEIKEKYDFMFTDYPDIVTVPQLRKMLGISRHLAYDLIAQKKIKAFELGNAYKILKLDVIDYILNSQEDLERTLEEKCVPDELK